MDNRMQESKFLLTRMIPSDQWHIGKDKAWFLSMINNDLFEVDMKYDYVKILSKVPEYTAWRRMPYCFKYKSFIYCLPDFGQDIWKYSLYDSSWKKIKIPVQKNKRYLVDKYWMIGEGALLLSEETRTILHLSLRDDVISKYDCISRNQEEIFGDAKKIGDNIYIVSNTLPMLYIYNISSGMVQKFSLPCKEKGFASIEYMDGCLWLSACNRFVYRLNLVDMSVDSFPLPDLFTVYNMGASNGDFEDTVGMKFSQPLFGKILNLHNTLWLIPEIASKILYMKKNGLFKEFKIRGEEETAYTAKNRGLNVKYVVLYTRENRYIGIFSYKNEHVIEIDTLNKKYKVKEFYINSIPYEAYRLDETNARPIQWLLDVAVHCDLSKFNKSVTPKKTITGETILREIFHVHGYR